MKFKKISKLLAVTLIFSSVSSFKAYAFQPASHCTLIENVKESLPQESIIKKSLETYPGIANWGSNALDLGYLQPGQALDRAPWADRYHYYKVGTFASEQLKMALASKDMKKIAFAAGWLSHVTGDLACHGIFVNPECGVYLDNENTRPLHRELENNAEAIVWADIAKKPIEDYSKGIAPIFSNIEDIPFDLVNDVSQKVYGVSANLSEEKLQCKTLMIGLQTGIGYNYGDLQKSKELLSQNGRLERLKNAFIDAQNKCTSLLIEAEKGDYSKFSDRWNLDVGKSASPISSLTAVVETGNEFGNGTDDDIFLNIQLKNGTIKEWKLDKKNYNDFEQGDNDEYYLYINEIEFAPSDVDKVIVKKKGVSSSIGADWYLKAITVNVNGTDALKQNVDNWIKGTNTVKEFKVDWSSITNTSDAQ
ncbi:zinc dependent phospholipase C family protein [Clostridium gasigenes]|uniref:zinc dependent phospholipase C family protein n=1 Tax=Clostridium gasigenes TaxID=94869 RepID=UPI001C0C6254|nr:zinc dependent phospholipase C family protein [Clostridium gasigenes]MBU3104417.1 zinc dependent phospholipase C family protein [Clostridium gasigenes]MBU3136949.1 zinc dependent phospholipase C family protein [Clostridium gasigenes]